MRSARRSGQEFHRVRYPDSFVWRSSADNLGLARADRSPGPELVYRSQTLEMTMETTPKPSWLRMVLGFLVLSTGLATIFTGGITAWQAWEERLQEHWPGVTAHVDTCDLQQTSSGERAKLSVEHFASRSPNDLLMARTVLISCVRLSTNAARDRIHLKSACVCSLRC